MFVIVEDILIFVIVEFVICNWSFIDDVLSKGVWKFDFFLDLFDVGYESVKICMWFVILECINKFMDLYVGEFFGVSVLWYIYEIEDEMIEFVNDIEYGLVVLIYVEDFCVVFRVVDWLDFGVIYINFMIVYDEFFLLYGGVKKSGFGWFNGI